MPQPPSITVVTPSYNQARYLEAALRSVINQNYPRLEYIVMDGGSDDGSAEIIERYDHHIAYWSSQKDKGQSDALRKGFQRASGDIFTWLNSDDILLPGTLQEVGETFQANENCKWALGNVVWIDAGGQILRCRKGERYWSLLPRLGVLGAYGPSAFFTKELYKSVGGVNVDLHYMMDTELWWRFVMSGAKFHRLQRYSWALRLHAEAKMSGHLFSHGSSEAEERVARAKQVEREKIECWTRARRKPMYRLLGDQLNTVRRACSPQYLKGLYESRIWRGRQIEELMGAQ